MYKRRRLASCAFCLLSAATLALADVDPAAIRVGSKEYDLSGLNQPQTAEISTDSPPTRTITRFYVSLWSAVPAREGAEDRDQCPAGSRVCAVVTNEKDGTDPRVISVIPIAGEYGDSGALQITAGEMSKSEGDFLLTLSGGEYMGQAQKAEIAFKCEAGATGGPEVDSYSSSGGLLKFKWTTANACAKGSGDAPVANQPATSSGRSVFSIFFWLVLIAFGLYFLVGSWINRSQYGATGLDMLPNRDFWRDLPFIVKEFFTPSRSQRAGYSSLG